MSIAEKLLQLKEDMDAVYEKGKKAAQQAAPESSGWQHITVLNNIFREAILPEKFDMVLNVPNLSSTADIASMLSGVKNLRKLTLKCGREDVVLRSYFAFGSCHSVREIDLSQFCNTDVVKITKAHYMFYADVYLERVCGELDFSECTELNTPFQGCNNLTDFEVVPSSVQVAFSVASCPNLSDETRQSIVDGLADLTGQTAQTLTFHATAGAKLTDAQKAIITAKNWTLVY